MQKQHFRSHNLIVTIAPAMIPKTLGCCPSGTCCGPPSALFDCYFSQLLPPAAKLSPDDLRTILHEVRSKLEVEDLGLDVVLETESEQDAAGWRKVVEGEGLRRFKADTAAS